MARRGKEITTYEYFKVDEVFFWGKHKDYIDKLWKLNQIQESYFARLVDLYAVAAIVGLKLKRKSPEADNQHISNIDYHNENGTYHG